MAVINFGKLSSSDLYHKVYLYFCVISINLITFTIGTIFAWGSPCIPMLNGSEGSEKNPLSYNISAMQESWLVSITFVGAMTGNIITMFLVKKIGRKKTLLLLSLPSIVGHFLFIFGSNYYLYLVGRFLSGNTLGVCFQIVPGYVAEISEVKNRGAMGSFFAIFIALGHQLAYSVGPFVSFVEYNIICVIIPIIFVILVFFFISDSPFDYIIQGDLILAKEILKKLRYFSTEIEVQNEFDRMIENHKIVGNSLRYSDFFRSKNLRKAMIITVGIAIIQQLSAINAVISYMQTIFDDAGGNLSPKVSPIIVGLVQLVATLIIPHIIDRFGRKIILSVSQFLMAVSVTGLGTYFFLKERDYNIDNITWLPLACLMIYIIFFNTGVGSVWAVIMSELFEMNAKNVAHTIATFALNTFAFILTWLFPVLLREIEAGITFWIVSVLCFLGFIFICIVLPETKGKTISEIQDILRR